MYNIKKNYISLIIWVLALIVIGVIIGSLTKSDVAVWYATLNQSSLTPPNYVFGIAWSILYAIIGIVGWVIWQSKVKKLGLLKILYVSQLLLNWSWTPLFFTCHLIRISFLCIVLIILLVALIIFKTYKELKVVSLLFIPYLLWLLFAAYLNFYIWQYNA